MELRAETMNYSELGVVSQKNGDLLRIFFARPKQF